MVPIKTGNCNENNGGHGPVEALLLEGGLGVGVGAGEGDGDGGALVGAGTGRGDFASVLTDDGVDEEEAETGAFDFGGGSAGGAVEALEDALELIGGKADALVRDGDGNPGIAVDGESAADVDGFGRVFNCVVEDVEDCSAEVFKDAKGEEADIAGDGFKEDAIRRKVITRDSDGDAVGDEGAKVDEGTILPAVALAELAGLEDLLDGGEETVGVGEHDFVEVLTLRFFDGASLEGFEVEADAGDGGFELVSDGVDERVLTLVAANFADEEDGIEYDPGDESGEEEDTEDKKGDGALAGDHDPANVEGNGESDEENAEGDEEGDGSAASVDVHGLWGSIAGLGCEDGV
jgi:hypothetical protein